MTMAVQRVLIAEADLTLRRLLYRRLLDLGVFSDCVFDGREAVRKLAEHPYGVALIDLGLPGGSAEHALERIRRMPAAERPIVLALGSEINPRSLDLDVVQVIIRRPIDPAQLADLVQSCLQSAADHASRRARTQQQRDERDQARVS